MSVPLTKVDSAIAGLSISDEKPTLNEKEVKKVPKKDHKRTSSTSEGIWNIKDLEEQGIEITLPIETQKTGWKLNTSPNSIEDKDILKLHLVNPPVKKIDLHFPLGLVVTARNLKGVTIKDAMDAIYKQFKKKADDELEKPYLAGFEWDKDECWTRLLVHQTKEGQAQQPSKKSKKKAKEEA
ncbi:hypothetical protein N7499_000174 [Penicillium canescens]|uniref:DUF6699 domain-containing protein n=1 Tax=Penicillium canescens TaxID=5083 RepID=A0AAD6NAV7_PENCN|nr:uncharacterized protein N7446_011624 [Penicillium canescens]KAJ6004110.1 hypothetical protein N7522_005755 [Penicillium canescens]KAJ6029033.1 hypothetical protein N7444_012020 [Penicillium canescens]KAJ6047465.1 hypothetical protein N7460_003612 [Penicillium canescens]KAJ6048941.1 hypothetical protein N7446_011624 [Penicillium canescens]KAJ6100544.1 hypothetical protein N7499_000174 [Penicillium canescens]